jgi:RNA 2',3'-cyclic 3'-phosphodiesterase
MRLFVAIALPPEAASELDVVVAPLRPSWPELRWTGVDAWHLTLAFLGEVDEVVTSRLARGTWQG